jgi:hypothetical protein
MYGFAGHEMVESTVAVMMSLSISAFLVMGPLAHRGMRCAQRNPWVRVPHHDATRATFDPADRTMSRRFRLHATHSVV